MVELKLISKKFDADIFKNFSFKFEKNNIYFLSGQNGSGKSTLLKIIKGIYICDHGEVIFENNLNQEQTHKDEVQEEVVIDDISIYEEKPAENLETDSNEVPQLFSDEVNPSTSSEDNLSENLKNEEEEFEIPAFLRKQKF